MERCKKFRALLEKGELSLPGCHNGLTARMAAS